MYFKETTAQQNSSPEDRCAKFQTLKWHQNQLKICQRLQPKKIFEYTYYKQIIIKQILGKQIIINQILVKQSIDQKKSIV
ncbi:unnamed protein product [Paramecium sonneborni]|uniref:Uncharacterized protein n=1 Tax=Paramecium sonneborni TaxID=65129 RepID=A0A8S1QSW3_9CILI|nr:unnamed protein product [Paramecium sonneborni]